MDQNGQPNSQVMKFYFEHMVVHLILVVVLLEVVVIMVVVLLLWSPLLRRFGAKFHCELTLFTIVVMVVILVGCRMHGGGDICSGTINGLCVCHTTHPLAVHSTFCVNSNRI